MLARREKPSGRLRVDAASPFMLHVIVPLVRGYRERFPQVELELNSNEGIIDLLERRTDVAIRIGRLKDSTLHSRLVGKSRLRILASPAYLAAHGLPRRSRISAACAAGLHPAGVAEPVAAGRPRWRALPDRPGHLVVERRRSGSSRWRAQASPACRIS